MKKLLVVLSLALLAGCTDNPKVRYDYVMPDELRGCKVIELNNGKLTPIKVVVCPQYECTSTTYSHGKTTANAAICK